MRYIYVFLFVLIISNITMAEGRDEISRVNM